MSAIKNPSAFNRTIYAVAALIIFAILSFAYYLEVVHHLFPCPLCILQRIIFITIGFLLIIATIHGPKRVGQFIYNGLGFLLSVCGIAVAGRQVWLQLHPETTPGICLPTVTYLLKHEPLHKVFKLLAVGSDDCAKIVWQFLGLSIPAWSLILFGGFAAFFIILTMCAFTRRFASPGVQH